MAAEDLGEFGAEFTVVPQPQGRGSLGAQQRVQMAKKTLALGQTAENVKADTVEALMIGPAAAAGGVVDMVLPQALNNGDPRSFPAPSFRLSALLIGPVTGAGCDLRVCLDDRVTAGGQALHRGAADAHTKADLQHVSATHAGHLGHALHQWRFPCHHDLFRGKASSVPFVGDDNTIAEEKQPAF